ncbi:MAG: hypothetical protein JNL40_11510 [Cyclobacteriaceae bacterium]|nr:hypothetical protein [Cyclobacteriaceae bacterium]
MRSVYSSTDLYNLAVIKASREWMKHGLILPEQEQAILQAHPSNLYHPNLIIRILLFIATSFALSGASGIFFLILGDVGEIGISIAALIAGIGSFVLVQRVLIIDGHHYKSGVVEAIIYHASGYLIGGVAGLTDANEHVILIACLLVLGYVAIVYIDLICTALTVLVFAGLLFYECYELNGIFRQVIPFVIIIAFSGIYFLNRWWKSRPEGEEWHDVFVVVESLSLLLIYAGGNYMVVRELSISLMNLSLVEGQDIPFAGMFYGLTAMVPIFFLYMGIKNRDIVLLRVSIIILAFSVFTFKYYFSLGRPEITLTIAGAVLLAITGWLLAYLKTPRRGFTREQLLAKKWDNVNLAGFVVSQTLGGNAEKPAEEFKGGGGQFGGGGASGSF